MLAIDFGPDSRNLRGGKRDPKKRFHYKEVMNRHQAMTKRNEQRLTAKHDDAEARENLERLNIEHSRRLAAQKRFQARQQQHYGQHKLVPLNLKSERRGLTMNYKGMLESLLRMLST